MGPLISHATRWIPNLRKPDLEVSGHLFSRTVCLRYFLYYFEYCFVHNVTVSDSMVCGILLLRAHHTHDLFTRKRVHFCGLIICM